MADDQFKDLPDEPAEQTPELTEDDEITDPRDTPDDAYVDDPDTPDINEAKLGRATDEVRTEKAEESPARRPRRSRPVRKGAVSGTEEPAESAKKTASSEETASSEQAEPARKTEPADETETETASKPSRAGAPIRTQKSAEPESKAERTTPVRFVGQSVGELRKVVWPTGTQVQQYFVVVLVFVLFIIAFVSLLDLAFGWVILRLFG